MKDTCQLTLRPSANVNDTAKKCITTRTKRKPHLKTQIHGSRAVPTVPEHISQQKRITFPTNQKDSRSPSAPPRAHQRSGKEKPRNAFTRPMTRASRRLLQGRVDTKVQLHEVRVRKPTRTNSLQGRRWTRVSLPQQLLHTFRHV